MSANTCYLKAIARTVIFSTIFAIVSCLAQHTPAAASNRKALVIGNQSYVEIPPAKSAIRNAQVVGAALRNLGFDVDEGADMEIRSLDEKLREFARKVQKDDTVIVYYSGLAIQSNQENYLLPVKFPVKNPDLFSAAYSVSKIDADLAARRPAARVLVLDGCNAIPVLAGKFDSGLALPQLDTPGVLVSLSAQPGKTAVTPESGSPGLFALKLAEALQTPGLTLEQVFLKLQVLVREATAGAQIPTYFPLALNPVYLAGEPRPVTVAAKPEPAVPEVKGPKPVLLRPFALAKGVVAPLNFGRDVSAEIGQQLPAWGSFDITIETDPTKKNPPPATGLIIEGEIIAYKAGSRAARALIGMGVGGTSIKARARFIDAATGKVLFECPQCEGFVKGGGVTGGNSSDSIHYLVEVILREAGKNHVL